MRVLHLGFEDPAMPGAGGGSVRTHEINRRLAARGHEITVLTTRFPGCVDRVQDGVTYLHVGAGRGGNKWARLLGYAAGLPSATRKLPADLVVEDFFAPFSSMAAPRWTGRPTIGMVQWLHAGDKSRQYKVPLHVVERIGVRSHRLLVAVSEGTAERLRALNPAAQVEVIGNGVERAAFAVPPCAGRDVVYIGRLEYGGKGLDLLLAAWTQVHRMVEGDLVIAGGGPDEDRVRRLFLSPPHLDDAVLSCGTLLLRAPRATGATVFTEASAGPHTRAARNFLRQCAVSGAEELFAERRREDVAVVAAAGAEVVHLGRRDALFRTRRAPAALGRVLPELVHRYPTFRFDIARGRVAAAERDLATRIAEQVDALAAGSGAEVVLCPLGVGRHVDHVLVQSVGPELGRRVVYYTDFPYALHSAPDPAFLAAHGLHRWESPADPAEKRELIGGYRSQVDALFPGGQVPSRAEEYYTRD